MPPRPDDGLKEAQAARQDTHRRFLEVVAEGEQIRQVTSDMKNRRIRNGYDELIEDALSRRPGRLL